MDYQSYSILTGLIQEKKAHIQNEMLKAMAYIPSDKCNVFMDSRDQRYKFLDKAEEELKICVQIWVKEHYSDNDGMKKFWGIK